jgi:hypothetical protein
MLDAEGRSLRNELLAQLREPVASPMPDELFESLALRIFAYQFERNRPYAAFCQRRGVTPDGLTRWIDIPAVPTAAFKEIDLVAGLPHEVDAIFRTSGTTRGRRGRHLIPDIAVYHAALLPNFRAHVVPELSEARMLSLIPPPAELSDSSLSHMIGIVVERLGAHDSGYYASGTHGLDERALENALLECVADGRAVVLLGTSFAFVHWTDSLRARNARFELPPGSRIMDTGGYKGRSREVAEDELRAAYATLLGIAPVWCVNEYGMTELCSQFYDSTLREQVELGAPGERRKMPPRWVRTVVVDPETLAPLPPGSTGLLRHIDLANIGSVVAVQTEDLGEALGDGFRVLGRATGSPPRGCSIAMDELLTAARAAR